MIAGTALERPPAALPAPSGSPDAVRAKPLKPAAQHAFSSSQGGAAASDRCVANRASARRPRAGGGESPVPPGLVGGLIRSEEHTSELQSLMRISYAVFCLKK